MKRSTYLLLGLILISPFIYAAFLVHFRSNETVPHQTDTFLVDSTSVVP